MNSYDNRQPDPQQVVDDLGDKFIAAFVDAIGGARDDLEAFQGAFPDWFINFSKRFIANFIHERTWDRMVREVSDHSAVTIVDDEPKRQVIVDDCYIIRFKRHRSKLQIRTYPTTGATAFWMNQAMIPGTETHSLALGYIWDADEGAIKSAILSYRTAIDEPVWSVELEPPAADAAQPIGWKPMTPDLPELDLSAVVDETEEEEPGT